MRSLLTATPTPTARSSPAPRPTWLAERVLQPHAVFRGRRVPGVALYGDGGWALRGGQDRQPLPDLLLVAPGVGTRPLSLPGPPAARARPPAAPRAYFRVWGRIFFPRRQSASALSMSSCTSSACGDAASGRLRPRGPPRCPAHLHLVAVEEVDVGLALLRVLAHEQQHGRVAQLVQHRLAVPDGGQREVLQLLLGDRKLGRRPAPAPSHVAQTRVPDVTGTRTGTRTGQREARRHGHGPWPSARSLCRGHRATSITCRHRKGAWPKLGHRRVRHWAGPQLLHPDRPQTVPRPCGPGSLQPADRLQQMWMWPCETWLPGLRPVPSSLPGLPGPP